MIAMEIRYDTDADAMFVWFRERAAHPYAEIIDDVRMLRMDDDGVAGVEFLEVSHGLNLDDIPHADDIPEALRCIAAPAALIATIQYAALKEVVMRVIKASEGASEERTGQAIFEGQVWGRGLSSEGHLGASIVQFAAGARTRMHTHTSDQLLYVVSGIGKVGTNEGEQVIATGDVALIPAGEPHWHGAGDTGSPMSHLTVMRGDSETEVLG